MDHARVLKRAWEILWRYRVLWIFGVIVALTAGGGAGGGGNYGTWSGDGEGPGVPTIPPEVVGTLVAIGVALLCLVVILTIVRLIAQYVSQTALIRMVDDYEETGERRGVREGFRLGWSRTALRLFVIDLLTRIPGFLTLFVLALLGAGLFGLMVLIRDGVVLKIIGAIAGIGVGFLVILASIVISVAISLVRPLIFRVCALEERGVIESLRVGFDFVKAHLADTVIMWLIMVGVQIGWVIVMIPVLLLLLLAGGVLGGLAGLTVGGLSSLVFEGAIPWIAGFGVGIPIFILVVAAPSVFLGGLAEVFKSSVWTLTYRELRALGDLDDDSRALTEPASTARIAGADS